MRSDMRLFAVLTMLALPVGVAAMGHGHGHGKPQPIPCPADVGAALAAECPCAGTVNPDMSVNPWRNHGQFMKCVVHFRNALRKSGCLTDSDRRTIASCAARSTCGKDKVLCCHYVVGSCSDPTPGDMVKAGVCDNDATLACDTADDCTTSSARITRDATMCMADGGVVVDGGGSVCTPCPTTTTTTTTTTLASSTTTTTL
jgi:hypothetical protein